MEIYKKKYLKYKKKYLLTKKNIGGSQPFVNDTYYINDTYYDSANQNCIYNPTYKHSTGFILYRIKLGYITKDTENIPINTNYMGEAFDLSNATGNAFFGALKLYFSNVHGIRFTLDKFIIELMQIVGSSVDDKTIKRRSRLNFLKKCREIRYLQILFTDMCTYINGGNQDKNGVIFTVSGGNIFKIFVKLINGFRNNNSYNPYDFFLHNKNTSKHSPGSSEMEQINALLVDPYFMAMLEESKYWSDFDFSLLYKNTIRELDAKITKLNEGDSNEEKIYKKFLEDEKRHMQGAGDPSDEGPEDDEQEFMNYYETIIDNNPSYEEYLKSDIYNSYIDIKKDLNESEINFKIDNLHKYKIQEKIVSNTIDDKAIGLFDTIIEFIKENNAILHFKNYTGSDIKNTIRILKNDNFIEFVHNFEQDIIGQFLYPQIVQQKDLTKLNDNFDKICRDIEEEKNKLVYLDHHLCHAAFGYFQSSFADADILTIDGHGENETCFLGSAKNGNITKLDQILYPHSVGLFYGTFTNFLGFKPDSDEWKVMALSAFDVEYANLLFTPFIEDATEDIFTIDPFFLFKKFFIKNCVI